MDRSGLRPRSPRGPRQPLGAGTSSRRASASGTRPNVSAAGSPAPAAANPVAGSGMPRYVASRAGTPNVTLADRLRTPAAGPSSATPQSPARPLPTPGTQATGSNPPAPVTPATGTWEVQSIDECLRTVKRNAAAQTRVINGQTEALGRIEIVLGELLQTYHNSSNASYGNASGFNQTGRAFAPTMEPVPEEESERTQSPVNVVNEAPGHYQGDDGDLTDRSKQEESDCGEETQRHAWPRFGGMLETEAVPGLPDAEDQNRTPWARRERRGSHREELYQPIGVVEPEPEPEVRQLAPRQVSIAEPVRDQPPHQRDWPGLRRASGPFSTPAESDVPAAVPGAATAAATPVTQHQLAATSTPRAAGYPIGAVPVDNVSRDVITALQRHAHKTTDSVKLFLKALPKLGAPPSYNGSGELKVFEQWVNDLLRWFRLHYMLGPDADDTRVNLIRLACTNVACDWFQHHVERSPPGPEGWITLEVIQGLQRRFITLRSAAEATQEFCLLAQGTMAAVELYQELRTLAAQLPSEPDAYTFRQRYMEALHPRIAQWVMGLGYSAERTEIEVLVEVDVAQEAALASQRHFDQMKPSGSSSKKRKSLRTAAASAAVVALAKVTPAKSGTRRMRNTPRDGSRRDTRCYNCNKVGHIASACPTARNTVAGKSVVVVNDRSDNKEPTTLTSARANPVLDDQKVDAPAQAEASSELEVSNDSLWDRFENAFSVGSRACTIVPLGDEVKACVAKVQDTKARARKPDPEAVPVHAPASLRRQAPAGSGQPVPVPEDQQPITGYYRVGGVLEYIMFESGSSTDMVSPEFVRATRLKPVELDNPVGLQMALISSRGQINFGLNTQLKVGPYDRTHYFDIANIEKYNVLLSMPFLRKARAYLDFNANEVVIGTKRLPSQYRADATAKERPPKVPRGPRSMQPEPSHSAVGKRGGGE
ncbi:hypothetical protein FRC09_017031 [Ceratobasidium sp. 395]|nr:hypothetical protein FRC09_017031 [Ceratobasidium sp. 395]